MGWVLLGLPTGTVTLVDGVTAVLQVMRRQEERSAVEVVMKARFADVFCWPTLRKL